MNTESKHPDAMELINDGKLTAGWEGKESKHVDDYSEDPRTPPALLAFLHVARAPAYIQIAFGFKPVLYATVKKDIEYQDYSETMHNPPSKVIKANTLVRVTMASFLGDLGIATRLDQENGYDTRVSVDALTDFTNKLHAEVESLVPRRTFIEARIDTLTGVINTFKAKGMPVDPKWQHELTDRNRELKGLDYKARQEWMKLQKRSVS